MLESRPMTTTTFRLQVSLPAPFETQLRELSDALQVSPSDVIQEALSLFTKAVLEGRRGLHIGFVDDRRQVLSEFSSPSLTRLEWDAQDEGRIVLPDSDFDRVAEELEKPAKILPRLRARSERNSR